MSRAEILKDYSWSTNKNTYVDKKGNPISKELLNQYNKLVQEEHKAPKNELLEYWNAISRDGIDP